MSDAVPTVMVSSTFYDLKHVRAELANFIADHLGYTPLLSELHSFPVDPDVDTIENCRRRVEQNADILVLIIGGRYGAVDSVSAKSITNLEYQAARVKGIPIFAFIDQGVLDVLPIWRATPTADFSSKVSDTRVFNFIEQVRDVDKVWSVGFSRTEEIIETLRRRFAYLFSRGLKLITQTSKIGNERFLRRLKGDSLRLVLDHPPGWEYELLAGSLEEHLRELADKKRAHELSVAIGHSELIEKRKFHEWIRTRSRELVKIINAAQVLLSRKTTRRAFGKAGADGDAEFAVFVAERLGALYERCLDWATTIRLTAIDDQFEDDIEPIARTIDSFIQSIEAIPTDLRSTAKSALASTEAGASYEVKVDLSLNMDGFQAAVEKFDKLRGKS